MSHLGELSSPGPFIGGISESSKLTKEEPEHAKSLGLLDQADQIIQLRKDEHSLSKCSAIFTEMER